MQAEPRMQAPEHTGGRFAEAATAAALRGRTTQHRNCSQWRSFYTPHRLQHHSNVAPRDVVRRTTNLDARSKQPIALEPLVKAQV